MGHAGESGRESGGDGDSDGDSDAGPGGNDGSNGGFGVDRNSGSACPDGSEAS